jgi:hypothetical protein
MFPQVPLMYPLEDWTADQTLTCMWHCTLTPSLAHYQRPVWSCLRTFLYVRSWKARNTLHRLLSIDMWKHERSVQHSGLSLVEAMQITGFWIVTLCREWKSLMLLRCKYPGYIASNGVRWLSSYELKRFWKKVVVAWSMYYPSISIKRLRKTTINIRNGGWRRVPAGRSTPYSLS